MQYIGISGESYHPSNILLTDEPWKGRVLFTGPYGVTDHRVKIEAENRYVGIGAMSREGSSEASYLLRAAPSTPFPRPKTSHVGEIGWSIPAHTDWSLPNSGRQIMLGHFRQECEDRHSHLYQNAWYPGPDDEFPPESDAARVMNVYRPTSSSWPSRSTSSYGRNVGAAGSNQQQLQKIQRR